MLRVFSRLGWLKSIGLCAAETLPARVRRQFASKAAQAQATQEVDAELEWRRLIGYGAGDCADAAATILRTARYLPTAVDLFTC